MVQLSRLSVILFGICMASGHLLRNGRPCGLNHGRILVTDPPLEHLPMAYSEPALLPPYAPHIQGTNLFYKPHFILPNPAMPIPLVAEVKKDCKKDIIVPEMPVFVEDIPMEPLPLPPAPILPPLAMPEIPLAMPLPEPEPLPIIPSPPMLPAFVMPELPTVVYEEPIAPLSVETIVPEPIAPLLPIPAAPVLPPLEMPELPMVVVEEPSPVLPCPEPVPFVPEMVEAIPVPLAPLPPAPVLPPLSLEPTMHAVPEPIIFEEPCKDEIIEFKPEPIVEVIPQPPLPYLMPYNEPCAQNIIIDNGLPLPKMVYNERDIISKNLALFAPRFPVRPPYFMPSVY